MCERARRKSEEKRSVADGGAPSWTDKGERKRKREWARERRGWDTAWRKGGRQGGDGGAAVAAGRREDGGNLSVTRWASGNERQANVYVLHKEPAAAASERTNEHARFASAGSSTSASYVSDPSRNLRRDARAHVQRVPKVLWLRRRRRPARGLVSLISLSPLLYIPVSLPLHFVALCESRPRGHRGRRREGRGVFGDRRDEFSRAWDESFWWGSFLLYYYQTSICLM